MYERHLRSEFRDLLDSGSADWAASNLVEKVIDLKAFDSAGVSLREIVEHYRETLAQGGRERAFDGIPATVKLYREAGYWPPVPDDVEAAIDSVA
jgi:hypothetical protein